MCDGFKYLEKIVQVQISTPPFTARHIRKELIECISLAATEQDSNDAQKDDERDRINALLDGLMIPDIAHTTKDKAFP